MFDDPVKNTIYSVFYHAAIAASIIVNTILITCIVTCKRKEFGAYRFLLLTFASVDFYYSLVHFLVMPIPEEWANAFYMGAHGYFTGRFAVCWFAGAHSLSFPVLVFHFLYRFLAVKGSDAIRHFNTPWFFIVLLAFVFSIAASWFSILYYLYDTDEFVIEYMAPIIREHTIAARLPVDQYSVAVFWKNGTFSGPRWNCILGISLMASTMLGCYGFMIFAAYSIARELRSKTIIASENTMRMQRQLLTALAYQTILPLFTAYAPPLLAMMTPFFGMSISIMSDLTPFLCGSHPWIDGCVLLWTIGEYRKMVLRCLTRGKYSSKSIPVLGNTVTH